MENGRTVETGSRLDIRRFGAFEIDTTTGELRKYGIRLKLSDQPFRILTALLERPGQLVARDELKQRIWPAEAFGDFEQGLNRAVSKLREVLGDSAANPRFIETIPGRGYRFIGPVQESPAAPPPAPARWKSRAVKAAAAAIVLGLLIAGGFWLFMPPRVPNLRWRKLTTDNYQKFPPVLSDGSRVYFLAGFSGEQFIAQMPLAGGQPARLPFTLPGPYSALQDLSPDAQELLITAAAAPGRMRPVPLWTVRIADGTAARVGELSAVSAAYAPNGQEFAYSTGSELWVAGRSGAPRRRLFDAAGSRVDSLFWSPDGGRIRFSRRNEVSMQASAWEIRPDGTGLRRVFSGWGADHVPAGWHPQARLALFAGNGSFWANAEPRLSLLPAPQAPVPLLLDAPEFAAAVRIGRSDRFHAVGTDRLGELQRYDAASHKWSPILDGLSAESAEYSRDGRRIAYVTYPQRTLWVRQADGAKPIQLTSPPWAAAFPRWSPDNRRIAFSAQEAPGKPVRLYIVDSDGGTPRSVGPADAASQGYPTWTPDGTGLLFGIFGSNIREPAYLRMVDLRSGTVSKFEGSDGLFGPRWSPDGAMIAAMQWSGERHLMIYRVAEKRWKDTGQKVDWPCWTPDSKAIVYFSAGALLRYRVATGQTERLTDLKFEEMGGATHSISVGPDGSPLRTLNRDSRQIYELRF